MVFKPFYSKGLFVILGHFLWLCVVRVIAIWGSEMGTQQFAGALGSTTKDVKISKLQCVPPVTGSNYWDYPYSQLICALQYYNNENEDIKKGVLLLSVEC